MSGFEALFGLAVVVTTLLYVSAFNKKKSRTPIFGRSQDEH